MQSSKRRISCTTPFDQKHMVQGIFKFMPIRSVFALSHVSRGWSQFFQSVTFHPKRLNFDHDDNSYIDFDDDKPNVKLEDIPASRMQSVLSIVDSIFYLGGSPLNISPSLFFNVKDLVF